MFLSTDNMILQVVTVNLAGIILNKSLKSFQTQKAIINVNPHRHSSAHHPHTSPNQQHLTSRNHHVSVVHQQQLNNNNTNNNTGVSDASCQPEPNTETSDDLREELKKQELKKKKKQEEIIKLLVEEELGRKLSSNGDKVTIESFITDLVLDEVWLRIQNQSPHQQQQFIKNPPQQQLTPPPRDHTQSVVTAIRLHDINPTRHEKYSCEERPRVLKKLTPS